MHNDLVLRMFLLPAIGPDDAIAILRGILEQVEAESRELRACPRVERWRGSGGSKGVRHIAAEYGVRADESDNWVFRHCDDSIGLRLPVAPRRG